MTTMKRLSEQDVKAIFASLHNPGMIPPPHLSFRIVPVGTDGLKLSPPSFEFDDGLFVLLRPDKKRKHGDVLKSSPPAHLNHLVVKAEDLPPKTCPWSLSGPQFPSPHAVQQRYCYPKGREEYSARTGGALWTMFDPNGNEDHEFRLLHVYMSPKRAANKGIYLARNSKPTKSNAFVPTSKLRRKTQSHFIEARGNMLPPFASQYRTTLSPPLSPTRFGFRSLGPAPNATPRSSAIAPIADASSTSFCGSPLSWDTTLPHLPTSGPSPTPSSRASSPFLNYRPDIHAFPPYQHQPHAVHQNYGWHHNLFHHQSSDSNHTQTAHQGQAFSIAACDTSSTCSIFGGVHVGQLPEPYYYHGQPSSDVTVLPDWDQPLPWAAPSSSESSVHNDNGDDFLINFSDSFDDDNAQFCSLLDNTVSFSARLEAFHESLRDSIETASVVERPKMAHAIREWAKQLVLEWQPHEDDEKINADVVVESTILDCDEDGDGDASI